MPNLLEKIMIDDNRTVILSFSAGFRFCGPITVGFYITNPADRFRDTQNQYYGLPGQYLRVFDINLENPQDYKDVMIKYILLLYILFIYRTKQELNVIESDNYVDKFLYIINQRVSVSRDYINEVIDNRLPTADVVGRLLQTKEFVKDLIPFKLIEKLPNYIHYDPQEKLKYSDKISKQRKPIINHISSENNSLINNNPIGTTNVNRDPRIRNNNNNKIPVITNSIPVIDNTNLIPTVKTSNSMNYYNTKRNYSEVINMTDIYENNDIKKIKIENYTEDKINNKEVEQNSKRNEILNKYKITDKPKDIPIITKTVVIDKKSGVISESDSDSEGSTKFTYSSDDDD